MPANKNQTPEQQLKAFSTLSGRFALCFKSDQQRLNLACEALRNRDTELVRNWLDNLAQSPAASANGNTILHHIACTTRNIEPEFADLIFGSIAKFPAQQLNSQSDYDGCTPLHEAACAANLPAVKALLAAGAYPHPKDRRGRTPLAAFLAQKDDDFYPADEQSASNTLRALISGGADPNGFDQDGLTPLARAIRRGKPEWCALLLDAGAMPLDATNPEYSPHAMGALEFALGSANGRACLGALLEHAAETCKHELAHNPGIWRKAAEANDPQALRLLDDFCAKHSIEPLFEPAALFAAIKNGNPALTSRLAGFANQPIECDRLMMPALFYAALQSETSCIKELLRAGADPNLPLEATPEQLAERGKDLSRSMRNTRAALAIQHGTTPLMAACLSKDDAPAEEILRAGADIFAQDCLGRTAIDYAILSGSVAACSKLIAWAGARSKTLVAGSAGTLGPMQTAIECRDALCAQLLCQSGFDQEQRNDIGETALICAAREGCADLIKILLLHGANPRAADSHGRTALDKATSWERHEAAKALRSALFEDNAARSADSGEHTATDAPFAPIAPSEWEASVEAWTQERRREHTAFLSSALGPDGIGRAECELLGRVQSMSFEQASSFAQKLKSAGRQTVPYTEFSPKQLQAAAEGLDLLQSTLGPFNANCPAKRRTPSV